MIGKKLQKALGLAVEELKRRRHEYLTLEHVLYGIASEPSGRKLIERCGGSAPVLRQALDHFFKTYMESLDEPTKDVYQTLAVQRVLDSALAHVKSAGRDEDIGVEVGDVLAAILEEEEYSWAAYCLKKQGITRLAVLESISHNDEEGQDESSSESGEGEGGAESAKDALARYTVDLTARAREGKLDPLVGREMELSRSIEILARRRKNNPLYVGDPGTGKTAIAEGLALRIVSGNVPPEFKDTKIYSLDLGAVLAGARYRGDFEGRIKAVVGALQKIPGAILFIDEIQTIVGAGSTSGGSMDASNLLKPILAEGKLRCIGSTTYDEFRNHFEKDRALARRFQKVDIKEPSLDECAWTFSRASSPTMRSTITCVTPRRPCGRRWSFPPAMCRIACCLTRPSTSWMRPGLPCGCVRASSPARRFRVRTWSALWPVWPGFPPAPYRARNATA